MSQHLTQKQIEGYGRRVFSAAELLFISDHLSGCELCRRLVERELGGDAVHFPLKAEASAASAERELWRRFVAALLSLVTRYPALVFGSALAALLLAAYSWLVWQTLQKSEAKPEAAMVVPSPVAATAAPVMTPPDSPTPSPASPEPSESPVPSAEDALLSMIARLNDGGRQVTLDQEGKLSGVDHLPPAYQQMIRSALTSRQLERSPLLAGLPVQGTISMRGGDNQRSRFSMIEPIGKVILSDRPTFRWSRFDGATVYAVEVYNDNFKLVAASSQLTGNSWTAPRPLRRGGTYFWQVRVVKDGQESIYPQLPSRRTKFRILNQAGANNLTQAQRAYASSHLMLGALYAQAGLRDEAERELRALQKTNPDSAIVRQLLANVRAMRRWRPVSGSESTPPDDNKK